MGATDVPLLFVKLIIDLLLILYALALECVLEDAQALGLGRPFDGVIIVITG